MPPKRPALFLDRDGTLIEEVNYLTRVEQIRLLEGAVEALALAHGSGLATVLVTNQSAVARGMLSERKLREIHTYLRREISEQGGTLDAVYYCPHHPQGTIPEYTSACSCRKPQPGLLEKAASELGVDLHRSLMVGDTLKDVEAGRRAGCTTALVLTGYGSSEAALVPTGEHAADRICTDLLAAVQWFLGLPSQGLGTH